VAPPCVPKSASCVGALSVNMFGVQALSVTTRSSQTLEVAPPPDTVSVAPLPHFLPHLAVAERGAP
jgi:hypothetical protein